MVFSQKTVFVARISRILAKNSSKISRIEEIEDIKKKTFDEKYNLGKEFSEKD